MGKLFRKNKHNESTNTPEVAIPEGVNWKARAIPREVVAREVAAGKFAEGSPEADAYLKQVVTENVAYLRNKIAKEGAITGFLALPRATAAAMIKEENPLKYSVDHKIAYGIVWDFDAAEHAVDDAVSWNALRQNTGADFVIVETVSQAPRPDSQGTLRYQVDGYDLAAVAMYEPASFGEHLRNLSASVGHTALEGTEGIGEGSPSPDHFGDVA